MTYLIFIAIAYLAINALIWFRIAQLISSLCGYHSFKDFVLGAKETFTSILNGEPPAVREEGERFDRKTVCLAAIITATIIHLFLLLSVISWTWASDPSTVHALKYISNVWIGIFIYAILFWLVAEIVTFIRWLLIKTKPEREIRRKLRKRRSHLRSKNREESENVFTEIANSEAVSAVQEKTAGTVGKAASIFKRATHYIGTTFSSTHEGHRRFMLVRTGAVVILIAAFSIYGVAHSHSIELKTYNIKSDKISEKGSLKIALISDLHLGYSVDNEHIAKMVKMINKQDVDLVCLTGDIIDNDFNAISEPEKITKTLSKIKSEYGVYGVYGNHDIKEKLVGGFSLYNVDKNIVPKKLDKMMEDAGITILADETALIGEDIQLIGRIDGEKPNGNAERVTINELVENLDQSKYIIDMDHEPNELAPKVVSGVDLDLSGHTHNGQIFPGNLIMHLLWQNSYGMKKIGNFKSIVTSGVGVWGPAMRVGTNNEVVIVNVKFKEKEKEDAEKGVIKHNKKKH